MIGWIDRSRPMATRTSGGSSETAVNELTVVPHGCESSASGFSSVVTTVTPVTKRPMTSR